MEKDLSGYYNPKELHAMCILCKVMAQEYRKGNKELANEMFSIGTAIMFALGLDGEGEDMDKKFNAVCDLVMTEDEINYFTEIESMGVINPNLITECKQLINNFIGKNQINLN